MRVFSAFLILVVSCAALAQISQFPYIQNFDSVTPPALPTGWTSTQNRTLGTNDFTTAAGSARSTPNAVLSTNARITQTLFSPFLNLTTRIADSVIFYERRSATDTTGILVEASIDSGITFPVAISDTLHLLNPTTYVRRAFALPQTLSDRNNVRFRWRVLSDPRGGTTSTLRFDDIRITVKTQFDAGISTVRFSPQFPVVGDSVLVNATVRNYGIQPIQNFLVQFYDDVNRDSIPQPAELFNTVQISSQILPRDSVTVSSLMRNLSLGDKQIIVQTMLPNDENPSNDRKMASFSVGVLPFSIVVNEIMYGPTSPEPEWIEITNTTTDSINLRQWKISDRNTATRATVTTADFFLLPGGLAVIAKDSAALVGAHPDIPSRIFHVPTLPILNNDSDAVVLFDQRGAIVDSVNYKSSWGGMSGRSLERIDPRGSSNFQTNWGSSTAPQRSTPGRKNSLTPKDFDIAVTKITFTPSAPIVGDSVFIRPTVKNLGRFTAQNILVEFFEDANGDSLPQPQERFAAHTVSQLTSDDSLILSAQRMSLQFGDHLFIVRAEFTGDEDTTNNTRRASISAGYPPGTIVINEIMYAPVGGEPEWVEFFNVSADSINLKNWRISNRNSSTRYTISAADVIVRHGEYVVVTKDTALFFAVHPSVSSIVIQAPSMPTFLFNNNGDAVVLFDSRGVIMDSVHYAPSWGGTNGRSLERVDALLASNDSTNWGSSQDSLGSTPGRQNSLTPVQYDLRALSIASSISGTSVTVRVTVLNVGREPGSNFSVALFHDTNGDSLPQPAELLERKSISIVVQPRDSTVVDFVWNEPGYGEKFLIAQVEYPQDLRLSNNVIFGLAKISYPAGTVVINEIMYAPSGGEPEWVEFYNVSADSINLKNWRISNRNSTSRYTITTSDIIVRRAQYAVVTKDTALFFTVHAGASSTVIQASSMPTFLFNNNGDAVVLFDSRGAIIDSVHYAPSWGGTNGRSLERVDALLASNDSTNWGSSQDSLGSTPGRQNSLTPVEFDLRALRIGSVMSGTTVTVRMTVLNVGREPGSNFSVALFYDVNGDSIPQLSELLERRNVNGVVQPRDSLRVDFVWNNPGYGRKPLIAEVEFPQDLRLSNNVIFGLAKISYAVRLFIINEIMYAPFSGQAEYVELYNRSQLPIDVGDWKIADMRDTAGKANEFVLTNRRYIVQPGNFIVVASDSSIFQRFRLLPDSAQGIHLFVINRSSLSLNNEGDDVVLSDLTGTVIDSVRYTPNWHNAQIADATGRSLERINPELPSNDRRNWSTSAHFLGGTPGKQNSIYTSSVPSSASLSFSPNPFSPDGDGHEDFTLISYEVPATAALLRIRIYDAKGRLIRTLVNSEPTGARGNIVWDGMNDNREKVRMGIYIVLLEALDANGTTIHSTKGVVVVAVRL